MHVSNRAREAETCARRAVCWDWRDVREEGDVVVVVVGVVGGGWVERAQMVVVLGEGRMEAVLVVVGVGVVVLVVSV